MLVPWPKRRNRPRFPGAEERGCPADQGFVQNQNSVFADTGQEDGELVGPEPRSEMWEWASNFQIKVDRSETFRFK